MEPVNCPYCSKPMPMNGTRCAHCGGSSHKPSEADVRELQKKFIRFFIVLVVVCAIAIIFLPREIP